MIGRLVRYVRGSYPPVLSLLFAAGWAVGVSGLFAALDARSSGWAPHGATAVAAATLAVNLLLMRAVDDVRDLDYDRQHSPARPLPAGQVRIRDLAMLYLAGSALILVLNAGYLPALLIVAGQLGYALVVLAGHWWLHWPDPDNLPLTLAISAPAQILLHLYLYAGYLHQVGLGPDRYGLLAVVVVLLSSIHLELAKKIVRSPRPGERTYVTIIGLGWTVRLALAVAGLSAALFVVGVRPWSPWALLVLVPLMLPVRAGWRFRRRRSNRWEAKLALYYLLATFASFAAVGLIVG